MLLVTLRLKIEELEGTLDTTRKQRTEAQDNRDMLLDEVTNAFRVRVSYGVVSSYNLRCSASPNRLRQRWEAAGRGPGQPRV